MALPGNAGKFIRVLPTAVVATIVGSLLIALLIIPFLASRVLARARPPRTATRFLQTVMGADPPLLPAGAALLPGAARATVVGAIGGSLLLSRAAGPVVGSSLFPKADTPQFLVARRGAERRQPRRDRSRAALRRGRLATTPEVASCFANLGHGNPQIYYNQIVRNDRRTSPRCSCY